MKKILKFMPSIIIIMIFSFYFINKHCANDLFFDIKTGESIFLYGIDFKDHFSFIPNLKYLYHHWLYDILVYIINKHIGFVGLFILFYLIYCLFGIVTYYINYKYTKNKLISLVITIIIIYISKWYFSTRVQSITYILFILEIFFLEKIYTTGKIKYILYLLLISIIIANMHMPIWILYIILFFPYLIESLLSTCNNKQIKQNKLKYKIPFLKKIMAYINSSYRFKINNPKNNKKIYISFILIFLSGLISPYGAEIYTFFLKAFKSNYSFISEMQKTVLIREIPFILLILLVCIMNYSNKIKMNLRDILLIIGIFIFGLIANRNIIYVYILIPLIIIKYFPQLKLKKTQNIFEKYKINKNIIDVTSSLALVFILICFVNCINFKQFNYDIENGYPVNSVKYIIENIDYKNSKFYNEFNYGSYMEYNNIPVFIDSRAEVYNKNFNGGVDIIGDFLNVRNISKYKNIFNKYEFDYALVYYNSNIYKYLTLDKDFKIIYNEDDSYVLFEKIN